MADIALLKEHISDSGMSMVAISKKSGIVRETLYNRLKGVGDFTATEMLGLKKALKLSNADWKKIFF